MARRAFIGCVRARWVKIALDGELPDLAQQLSLSVRGIAITGSNAHLRLENTSLQQLLLRL